MGIDTSLNGTDLCGDELYIKSSDSKNINNEIVAAKRINIDYAEEYSEKLWRFFFNVINL